MYHYNAFLFRLCGNVRKFEVPPAKGLSTIILAGILSCKSHVNLSFNRQLVTVEVERSTSQTFYVSRKASSVLINNETFSFRLRSMHLAPHAPAIGNLLRGMGEISRYKHVAYLSR